LLRRAVIETLGKLSGCPGGISSDRRLSAAAVGIAGSGVESVVETQRLGVGVAVCGSGGQDKSPSRSAPVAINHLRTFSDKDVAARANKLLMKLRGPEMRRKNALIAKFTPIVVQSGDAVRASNCSPKICAVCQSFKPVRARHAPDLTGMGEHGPAELIVHVLDPKSGSGPNYYAYSVETRDGESYDGVISPENANSLTLRNASGISKLKLLTSKAVAIRPVVNAEWL